MKSYNIINAIILLLFACSKTFCADNAQNPTQPERSSFLSRIAACCCCSVNPQMVVNPVILDEPINAGQYRQYLPQYVDRNPKDAFYRTVPINSNEPPAGYRIVESIEYVRICRYAPTDDTNPIDPERASEDLTRDGEGPEEFRATIANAETTLQDSGFIIERNRGANKITLTQIRPGNDPQATQRWTNILFKITTMEQHHSKLKWFLEKLEQYKHIRISQEDLLRLEAFVEAHNINDIELNLEDFDINSEDSGSSGETRVIVRPLHSSAAAIASSRVVSKK